MEKNLRDTDLTEDEIIELVQNLVEGHTLGQIIYQKVSMIYNYQPLTKEVIDFIQSKTDVLFESFHYQNLRGPGRDDILRILSGSFKISGNILIAYTYDIYLEEGGLKLKSVSIKPLKFFRLRRMTGRLKKIEIDLRSVKCHIQLSSTKTILLGSDIKLLKVEEIDKTIWREKREV